jgi:DNA-binding NarL/FixJ family response regulator
MSLPRLLVVDDHEMVRRALVDLLLQAGFEVVGEASDGVDAVALAKQLEPEVVLMDLRMPVLGGLDATRLIRDACPATQVVLLTAFESPVLEQQAEEAGCFAYLVKGVPPATLRLVLHQAVALGRSSVPPEGSPTLEA